MAGLDNYPRAAEKGDVTSVTPAPAFGERDPIQQERLIKQLETFRDRLLRVDWRNRSILLRRIHKKWAFDLSFLPKSMAVIERVVIGRSDIYLIPDADAGEEAVEWRNNLTRLSRAENLIEEETGLHDFFVGFPFVQGSLSAEHPVRAPLVLFPVRLERRRGVPRAGWYLTSPEGGTPIWNRSFLAALDRVKGVSVPPEIEDDLEELLFQVAEEKDDPLYKFTVAIRSIIRRYGLPIDSEGELTELQPIEPLEQQEIEGMQKEPLRIRPHAVMGIFPQASSAIFADYEELILRAKMGETDQGIVNNLLEAPSDKPQLVDEEAILNKLDTITDNELNEVLPSDSSQDAALLEAQQAECVVVRGPPGTGKSQLIANLISNALSKGQTVALVCQKRAALDVVYQRLDKVNLSDYVVLLHDERVDRRDNYAKLLRLITSRPRISSKASVMAGDISKQIDETVTNLNEIVKPLWDEYFGGIKLHDLYLSMDLGYTPKMDLKGLENRVDYPTLKRFLQILPTLEAGSERFDRPPYPLAERLNFATLGDFDRLKMIDILTSAQGAASQDYFPMYGLPFYEARIKELEAFLTHHRRSLRWLYPKWRGPGRRAERFLSTQGEMPDEAAAQRWLNLLRNGRELLSTLLDLESYLAKEGVKRLTALMSDQTGLKSRLSAIITALDDFDEIQQHDALVAGLSQAEVRLLSECREQLLDTEGWDRVLRQEIYLRWIDQVEREHPVLKGDPFAKYNSLRGQLERLLEEKRAAISRKIGSDLEHRSKTPILPPGTHHGNRDPRTDWNKLANEFGKKRRVKPFRRLFDEFPFQLNRIVPCWLVSPETVSEVFPLQRGLFDLVIFDEASQLFVERALPAIYRGKRVLVAGDEKQLRPFDLFQIREGEDDEETEDEALASESLLILAKRIYGFRYLSWHYRSKYQELIDFSNQAFYEGQLQIAGNIFRKPLGTPIKWVRCDGVWDQRRNVAEAASVTDEIAELLREGMKRKSVPSIGVVTFNDPQRQTILDAIDSRRERDPDFDRLMELAENPSSGNLDDRLFVKNIENVQGDERDVIIFSIAYARDHDGIFRAQFGSLNMEGGENRLNVAVTRARRGVVVVCSFEPEELRVEHTLNPGPKLLKQYLRYAKAVSEEKKGFITKILDEVNPGFLRKGPEGVAAESPLEEEVREALESLGYTIDRQVGYSGYRIDLAVVDPRDPSRYVLGIECDGATFHSARCARERDVLRQSFLESRGWRVERVWSRNWWRNRVGEIERIRAAIEEASKMAPKVLREREQSPME